jgi:hypothetical protein
MIMGLFNLLQCTQVGMKVEPYTYISRCAPLRAPMGI